MKPMIAEFGRGDGAWGSGLNKLGPYGRAGTSSFRLDLYLNPRKRLEALGFKAEGLGFGV